MTKLNERSKTEKPVLFNSKIAAPYPIRVAYDGHAFINSDGGTGKGSQLRNLLGAFRSGFIGLSPLKRVRTRLTTESSKSDPFFIQRGKSKYLIWQQTWLPLLLAKISPDVFLAPYNTAPLWIPRSTMLVTVVHDLILFENLIDSPILQRLIDRYRAMLLRRAIKRSFLILTVSNFTADQVRRRYPDVSLHVIHCTVGPSWYVRGSVIPQDKRDGYILIVTNFRAHKNTENALRAFAAYRLRDPTSTLRLHMVGVSRDVKIIHALMKDLGLPGNSVVIEPFLKEEDLQQKYRKALCVIIPSRMEGFGIPVLEAMASGTPLLCSNAWSLPEVGGAAPLYFDPGDIGEMTQGLFCLCTNPILREQLAEKGLTRAEEFHPDRVDLEVKKFWSDLPELHKTWASRTIRIPELR